MIRLAAIIVVGQQFLSVWRRKADNQNRVLALDPLRFVAGTLLLAITGIVATSRWPGRLSVVLLERAEISEHSRY